MSELKRYAATHGTYPDDLGWYVKHEEADAKIAALTKENEKLRKAIIDCIENNLHLADGENCTLIDLKRAVPEWRLADE